jgi:Uncharacterized protein conserved in bacteria (DUF2058)
MRCKKFSRHICSSCPTDVHGNFRRENHGGIRRWGNGRRPSHERGKIVLFFRHDGQSRIMSTSLRDQLLKAGLINKKQANEAERQQQRQERQAPPKQRHKVAPRTGSRDSERPGRKSRSRPGVKPPATRKGGEEGAPGSDQAIDRTEPPIDSREWRVLQFCRWLQDSAYRSQYVGA